MKKAKKQKKPQKSAGRKDKPSALETAHEVGFNRGWNDAEAVSPNIFARLKAKIGYGKGMSARRKALKLEKKIARQNKRLQKIKGK